MKKVSYHYNESGQHWDKGGAAVNNGQRTIKDRGVRVGQQSGGEQQMKVPAVHRSVMINTTRGPKG